MTIVAHKGQAQSKRPRPNASSAPGESSSRNLDVEGDASIGGQLTVRGDLKVEGEIIGRVTSPDADVAEWFCRVNVNEPIGAGDVVITADIPLAARAVAAGARVLRPNGEAISEAAVGEVLATRNLMTHLRETGTVTGGPAPFTKRDRSRFLDALETTIRAALQDAP